MPRVVGAPGRGQNPLATRYGRNAFGDVFGKVPEPLKLVGDTQCPNHFPEIGRDRLAARNDIDGLFLNPALQAVDQRVGSDEPRAALLVSIGERMGCLSDLLLDQAAHFGKQH